jgi:hypothetical protein
MRLALTILICWLLAAVPAAEGFEPAAVQTLDTGQVVLQFEEDLQPAAVELSGIYATARLTLVQRFGWPLDFKPTLVLVGRSERFRQAAGSALIAAYAVPARNLIVLDYRRLSADPGRLEAVTKHELVHLLLHHHIDAAALPRWLDEGVAQWISEGIGELLVQPRPGLLEKAVLSGNHLPLARLERRFPSERDAMLLAYEQSRSVVQFIAEHHGDASVFAILEQMRQGSDVDAALQTVLSLDSRQLEKRWLQAQRKPSPWLTFLARNIYSILFLFGALLTLVGFVRFLIRKRNYRDEDDEFD